MLKFETKKHNILKPKAFLIQKTEISYAGSKEIPPVSDTKEANTTDTGKLYQITKEFITAVVKSRQGNADKNIE